MEQASVNGGLDFVKLAHEGMEGWWYLSEHDGAFTLKETQSVVFKGTEKWINGAPETAENQLRQVGNLEQIRGEENTSTGRLGIFEFLATMTDKDTIVHTWKNTSFVRMAGKRSRSIIRKRWR